jgi:hypothetical protein
MKFFKLIFHLLCSIKKNTSVTQFLFYLFLFILLMFIGIITFIKVVIPFTYIAL